MTSSFLRIKDGNLRYRFTQLQVSQLEIFFNPITGPSLLNYLSSMSRKSRPCSYSFMQVFIKNKKRKPKNNYTM